MPVLSPDHPIVDRTSLTALVWQQGRTVNNDVESVKHSEAILSTVWYPALGFMILRWPCVSPLPFP